MITHYSTDTYDDGLSFGLAFSYGGSALTIAALVFIFVWLLAKKNSRILEKGIFIGVVITFLVAAIVGGVITNVNRNNYMDAAAQNYVEQLTDNSGLVNVDKETVKSLGLVDYRYNYLPPSWENEQVGTLFQDSDTAVYWKNGNGELEFAKVVPRVISSNELELVSVSGEKPVPLLTLMGK